jgi:hypothetical protein
MNFSGQRAVTIMRSVQTRNPIRIFRGEGARTPSLAARCRSVVFLLRITIDSALNNLCGAPHKLLKITCVSSACRDSCLHVTLGRQLKALAPGLAPRAVLEQFAAVQMIDVFVPTTDGRELSLTRYTQPEPELKLLLEKLKLTLPTQPPPKITAAQAICATPVSCRPFAVQP